MRLTGYPCVASFLLCFEFTKNSHSGHFSIITSIYICYAILPFKLYYMPKFITSIRLQEANERDYANLTREMKKYSFQPVSENKSGIRASSYVFNSTGNKGLLDTTVVVSQVAASTGKKYSFTVIKEKSKLEA